MVIYLDTSALLKIYIEEEGRKPVMEAVSTAELVATSTVAYAEARAELARRAREGDFTEEEHRSAVSDLDEDWQAYFRLDVTNFVSYRAGELAESYALRGFDAVHLESAIQFDERFEKLRFLAFDDRLTDAAREAALVVYDTDAGSGNADNG